ncbi:MAG: hypothetical protein ACYTFT_07360 [Planctomycetota bacterium]|jgi:cytochrome oxidase Cu insertion factor (SCO1/SenC/PrrC family)
MRLALTLGGLLALGLVGTNQACSLEKDPGELPLGAKVKPLTFQNEAGETVTREQLQAGRMLVLVTYRGHW